MNPKLKDFLAFIDNLKPKLKQMDFIKTQSNVREASLHNQKRYMTDIDYTIFARDYFILHDKYPVCFRIYLPTPDIASEMIFFIHGGGHVTGSVAQYDGVARKIAKNTNKIVISIDYRLSPEFSYPTGLNDCKAVIQNIFPVLIKYQIKYIANNITLMGDSAGGALCASLSMDREFVLNNKITTQVLIYPSLDYTLTSASVERYKTGYFLEKDTMEWFFNQYCPNIIDRRSISPLYGNYYKEMPHTLVITAAYDPLVDEGYQYYNNIQSNGVRAKYVEIADTIHAFLSLENLCEDASKIAYHEIKEFCSFTI